jgi:hypothetical protein
VSAPTYGPQPTVPGFLDAPSPDASGAPPAPLDHPALAGLPHPAGGRTWNREYASGWLIPLIRADLMYAVLRFTNEEIADDPARVFADIESLLLKKRTNEGNLP